MKRNLLPFATALLVANSARADFYPIPLTPGSFNKDVVVERTATKPAQALVTANMDAGTNVAGITAGGGNGGNQGSFYERGFGTTQSSGMPFHGANFNAVNNANHHFRMPPDYTTNNAIYVGGSGTITTQVVSGAFALTTPAAYDHLSVLASAGNGPTRVVYYVNYADGNQDANFFDVLDWFSQTAPNTNTTAILCNGDFRGSDGSFQESVTPPHIRIFYNDIPLSFPASLVTNIVFVYYNGGRAAIFGLSGSTDGGTVYNPIDVSGYTYDMIIENQNINTITATMDGGTNRTGTTWFEIGYNLQNPAVATTSGIPLHGSTFNAWSNATYTFTMPATYVGNDAVMVNNQLTTANIVPSAPAAYARLAFLESAGNGPLTNVLTISYLDGTSQTTNLIAADWFNNTPTNVAYVAGGRVRVGDDRTIQNSGTTTGSKLFYDAIALANTTSPVTNIACAYGGGGRVSLFAMSGDATGTGPFSPISFSGYNADVVVENFAISNLFYRAFTTATMDGGTNNNANTWFEQGLNPFNLNSGLPQAGSFINSTNLPDHHYVMPATYAGPNAAYCDSNNPVTTITFATPTNLLAVSFLSANANGGIQIQVILNHQSAIPETNVFNSLDWFNGVNPAFTAAGRLNVDTLGMNNFIPVSTNPRFYEAQFAVQNTTDPIVSATLRWTTNNGTGGGSSTSSRFVVMAVSGTTNLVAPILTLNPVGTNVYEGSNIVLNAFVSGGTPPITYEWRKGTNGVYGAALANGGTISGAATTNLAFTSIGWSNSGDYVFIARGTGGATTSSVAVVNAYSTLPDVTVPSDPIVEYQPNGGSSPGAETVPHAIDRLVGLDPAKYVNNGQNGGGSPFVGPVGFVVSPRLGKTTVSAVRLYPADNNQQNDPANWLLEGSNDGGASWATIHTATFTVANGMALPVARNAAASAAMNPLTQNVREIRFPNTIGYTSYRVSFANTTNDAVATAIGIGEVELLGTATATKPLIVRQPRNTTVWPGANPEFSVLAVGSPTNLAYQWFRGVTLIPGATRFAYTLTNAQVVADNGATFSCTITNLNGSTNSTAATLTVSGTAPTQTYPVAIITDHPVGFWRMGEAEVGGGDNGVIAHDYFGGLDGSYSNVVLGASGYNPAADPDTAATFGTIVSPPHNSYVDAIQGVDFASPTNTSVAFSIEAWVLNGIPGGQSAGAGIVTKGYGAGGEQFLLDTGAGGASHTFRFVVRNAAGAILGGNANGTIGPTNEAGPFQISNPNGGNWHHLVGVVDEASSNLVLYVDGLSNAASVGVTSLGGILASPWPVTIGSRQPNLTLDYTNQFIGNIDDVAIYNYALTPNQVLNHYYAAQPLAIITLQPTNTDYSDGGQLTLYSAAYGPSLSYQWYQSPDQSTWTAVGGQTSPTFNSPSTPASFGPYAEVVVTDPYGSVTSSIVTLTAHSGAPVILSDLAPTNVVYAGGNISLQVVAYGTAPLTYQWYKSPDDVTFTPLANSAHISGAQSNVLTISGSAAPDTAFYKVTVSNGTSTDSSHEYLLVQAQAMFNGNGLGWRLNGDAINGGAANSIAGGVFTPTDGTAGETRSVWYSFPQYITAFQASFTYQDVGGGGADGTVFAVQNQGPTAIGGAGGSLGYSVITPSVGLVINIYTSAAGGSYPNGGVLLDVNGLVPSVTNPYYNPAPLNIRAGNPIDVNVRYVGGIFSATLTDTSTLNSFTTNVVVNIPAILGTNAAFVGFTGSEGGVLSHQTVSNFVFTPLPAVAPLITATNTVVLTWPAAIGGFALQSSSSLAPQNWQPVTAPVTKVNNLNQVIVPLAPGNVFYRLSVQ